jgi:hypothetical protein
MSAPSHLQASEPVPARGSSLNFEALLRQIKEQFATLQAPLVERFQFELEGVAIDLRRIRQPTGNRFLIHAMLGYLPFSIESSERRQAVRAIVAATKSLPNVHFTIDPMSKITANCLLDLSETVAPDFIFYPLMLFFQEARPFMRLIAAYV